MSVTTADSAMVFDRSKVAERIFADIKQQIISGVLHRGAKLPPGKELAKHYGVSEPTVREALRGLSVIGLIDIRHGSGAYVSANADSMIAMSLGAVIQLESVGAKDALEILSVLNEHAAACAVKNATPADLERLMDAAQALSEVRSVERAAACVRAFHYALGSATHNPLLEAICRFLSDVQVQLASDIADGSLDIWKTMLDGLQGIRLEFVDAISRRNRKDATRLAREFHKEATRLITSFPRAADVQMTDPTLGAMLSSAVEGITRRH